MKVKLKYFHLECASTAFHRSILSHFDDFTSAALLILCQVISLSVHIVNPLLLSASKAFVLSTPIRNEFVAINHDTLTAAHTSKFNFTDYWISGTRPTGFSAFTADRNDYAVFLVIFLFVSDLDSLYLRWLLPSTQICTQTRTRIKTYELYIKIY